MKKALLNIAKYLVGLGLGLFLLYMAFKDTDWVGLKEQLQNANYWWVFAGIPIALISHYLRGLRWIMMMKVSGYKPGGMNTLAAILVGYMVNNAIPRGGEVARCTMLYKNEKVPMSVSGGTVITERVFDLIILLIFILLFLVLEFDKMWVFIADGLGRISGGIGQIDPLIILVLASLPIIGSIMFFIYREKLRKLAFYQKILNFVKTMFKAAAAVFKLENYWLFFLYTIGIWIGYGLMTYLPLLCFSEADFPRPELTLYFGFLLMTFGGIGMTIPSPGGIGSYHFAVKETFRLFFAGSLLIANPLTLGNSAAVIIHTSQLIFLIVAGFIAYIYLILKAPRDSALQLSKPSQDL